MVVDVSLPDFEFHDLLTSLGELAVLARPQRQSWRTCDVRSIWEIPLLEWNCMSEQLTDSLVVSCWFLYCSTELEGSGGSAILHHANSPWIDKQHQPEDICRKRLVFIRHRLVVRGMNALGIHWFLADPVLQFFSASAVYLVLSKVFPAHETFLAEAILGDDFGLNTPTEESSTPSAGDEKVKINVLEWYWLRWR